MWLEDLICQHTKLAAERFARERFVSRESLDGEGEFTKLVCGFQSSGFNVTRRIVDDL